MNVVLCLERELWRLLALAAIQFTHIVGCMVMIAPGLQLNRLFNISDAKFGLLVSANTFSAGASDLLDSFM